MEIKQITAINQVDSEAWNNLAGDGYPFMRHEFLSALEQSGCVSGQTGWQPRHVLVTENNELLAGMPLYLKTHSRGEYVFDNQWAYAYEQNGGRYYPKWLTAIPFTPCQGARIAIKEQADQRQLSGLLVDFIKTKSEQDGISSWHCLFPVGGQLESLRALGLAVRVGVQFQWFNKGYRTFDDFLGTLNASKRKMLKRERRKVAEQGIEIIQLSGGEVSEYQWQVFFDFYQMTYLKHGMRPYLNLDFFLACAATMGGKLLLVFALKEGRYVGATLSFVGGDTLFGRYWGCLEEYNALHFEACYYQGLDYCIANGLERFDSGAQGEHKIARGFEPVTTYSAHWFQDERFAKAIEQFLDREKSAVRFYKEDATNYLPFKK
ncbi:GNAT family N-acetyltransferase [Methyloglobulus sp.]|uniref:GNAT family N-acetyltransferase n=1 Tax=Methyloglobulus sp. TaxID=2518622 RepID=UPI003989B532